MRQRKLGKGLDELLAEPEQVDLPADSQLVELALDSVAANPRQPRKVFDNEELAALADSLAQNGMLQPVLVRRVGEAYELIAGERRLRAAKQAGLTVIPAVVRAAAEEQALELALVENIQRRDLNPIEKATAFKDLIDSTGLTQQEAARRLGKKRSSVANMIRLLELPEDIQAVVSRGTISMGHARALLALGDPQQQRQLCRRIIAEDLSVRQVEKIIAERTTTSVLPRTQRPKSASIKGFEEQLLRALGTRVSIIQGRKGRGKIIVDFFSSDEFERLFEHLTGTKV